MHYSKIELIKDLKAFVSPYKYTFIAGSILRLTSDIAWLFPTWALGQIVNLSISPDKAQAMETFWWLTFCIWAVALYKYLAHDFAKYLIFPIAEKMKLDSMEQAMKHMFTLDSDWHEKENSGNKIQRIHKAGDSLNEMMRVYIELIIESVVNIVGITIILMSIEFKISLIFVTFFISYYILSIMLTKKASMATLAVNIEQEKLEGILFESINNVSTIKSLGIWDGIIKWIKSHSSIVMEKIKKRVLWYRARSGTLNLFREAFRQILILYIVLQVFDGQLEVGVIAMAMLYFQKVSDSAAELAEVSYQFEMGRIAMMRYNQIINVKPNAEKSGTKAFPKNWKIIHVNDIFFKYKDHEVLKNLSFKIKRGQKIGIVGLSGAGKSTLFKLLLKLYDEYEGSILFDGEPLKNIKRKSYLKYTSYVPQETELFNLSLRENITLSLGGEWNKEAFEKAIEIAHIKDFLHKLPQGVDSLIGEKGVKLSGGEKQRVGIARALYKKPDLLLLDEASSHLDSELEFNIQKAMQENLKQTTSIVVAHRLSTLKKMDNILVIEKGQIIEEGSFQELLKIGGLFAKLWKKQDK